MHPERLMASSNQFPPCKSRNLCRFLPSPPVLKPPSIHPDTLLTQKLLADLSPDLSPYASLVVPLATRTPRSCFAASSLVFFSPYLVRMSRFSFCTAGAIHVRYAGCHCRTSCRWPG